MALSITSISPTSGSSAGGTPCTITGTDFTSSTVVEFASGRQAANITLISSTEITCESADVEIGNAGATVDIIVIDGAASDTLAVGYTYDPFNITASSPSSGPLAGGTVVTLTGNSFRQLATEEQIKFGTESAGYGACLDENTITVSAPAGLSAGSVDITIMSAYGDATLTGGYTYSEAPVESAGTKIRTYPWLDGFDYYATDRLTYKWASASNIHVSPTGGRRNSGCITPTGSGYLVSRPFKTETYPDGINLVWNECNRITIAFALLRQSQESFKLIIEGAGNSSVFEVEFTCSGRIAYKVTGETWQYTAGIVPFNEWCHFSILMDSYEFLVINVIDNQGRYCIDDYIIYTDLGWNFSEEYVFSTIRLESSVCGHWRIDDLYVINSTDPKQHPGDSRIDALEMAFDNPDSEYANWTLSTGSSFAPVLTQPAESATANTLTAAFSCHLNGLPHEPASIAAVQSNVWASYIDSDEPFALTVAGNQSADLNAPASEDGLTYSWSVNLAENTPWDFAAVNSMTIGVKVNG